MAADLSIAMTHIYRAVFTDKEDHLKLECWFNTLNKDKCWDYVETVAYLWGWRGTLYHDDIYGQSDIEAAVKGWCKPNELGESFFAAYGI